MTPDDRADALAAIAVELVVRVRDDDPSAVHRWLRNEVPDNDMMALAVILAAAVPDDRTWTDLTAWLRYRDERPGLAPHGTAAAAKRHQYHREPMCADCKRWDRDRKRARRQVQLVDNGRPQMSTGLSTSDVADDDEQDAA